MEKYESKPVAIEVGIVSNERVSSPRPIDRQREDLKRSFERFRDNYEKRREDAINKGRKRGRDAFEEELEGERKPKEKNEIISVVEYNRIFDFEENVESYRKKDGWREGYLNSQLPDSEVPIGEQVSIESYVYERQLERLEISRNDVLEQRVLDHFEALYPNLISEDEKSQREIKELEVQTNCADYFKTNRDKIEAYFALSGDEQLETKAKLQTEFLTTVFPDVDPNDTNNKERLVVVNLLFDELLNDYREMQLAIAQLARLNNTMVRLMSKENVTEEEWLTELEKEAASQLKKMEVEDKKKAEQEAFQAVGQPVSLNLNSTFFSGEISASEKLSTDTKISISMVRPGEYKIRFPSSNERTMESTFFARQVPTGTPGQTKNVYLFQDPLLDEPEKVDDARFKEMVNGVYLEHLMSDNLIAGRDYTGPDLNDEVLPDARMRALAERLIFPRKLNERPLTKEQADVFTKLLMVLVNKSNNEQGSGMYGDLLAMDHRVALLELALPKDDASKAKSCYNYLMGMDSEQLNALSVEDLCNHLGVPANLGNFKK